MMTTCSACARFTSCSCEKWSLGFAGVLNSRVSYGSARAAGRTLEGSQKRTETM